MLRIIEASRLYLTFQAKTRLQGCCLRLTWMNEDSANELNVEVCMFHSNMLYFVIVLFSAFI